MGLLVTFASYRRTAKPLDGRFLYDALIRVAIGWTLACAPMLARAGLVNDVPSCYGAFHLRRTASTTASKLVYVLIDQTVQLTPDLQRSVVDNINRMIVPNSKFVITEFSAFSQGHYLRVLHTGIVEERLPTSAYNSIPITAAPQIKACFKDQQRFAIKLADTTALQIMHSSSSSLDQSDILAAVQTVGRAIKADNEKNKVLFLVTDGLENSSVMSFYAHNSVRNIDPTIEFDEAKQAGMVANLAGAKVYILGGAMMPAATTGTLAQRNGYRDPTTLKHLREFWSAYFKAGGAKLVEFGEPGLVVPISY